MHTNGEFEKSQLNDTMMNATLAEKAVDEIIKHVESPAAEPTAQIDRIAPPLRTSPNEALPQSPAVEDQKYRYREHVVEGIAPAREVHLFVGQSGSGKTTLILQMLRNWKEGGEFFGHSVKPLPFVYVSLDRSRDDVFRSLERVGGIDLEKFPLVAPENPILTPRQLVATVKAKYAGVRVIWIEGFAVLTPQGKINDQVVVATFLADLRRVCQAENVTIFGTVHPPKMKEKDKYASPRDRIQGAAAWSAFSNLVIQLELTDPADANSIRQLLIMPRNGKMEKFTLDFRDGLLVPVDIGPKQNNWDKFKVFFDALDDEAYFTKEQAEKATQLPDSSIRAEIKRAVNQGLVAPVPDRPAGTYKKKKKT